MPPSDNLRVWILIGVGAIVVTPLSLLRNIESLSAICTLSISFYSGKSIQFNNLIFIYFFISYIIIMIHKFFLKV